MLEELNSHPNEDIRNRTAYRTSLARRRPRTA
jgi:hypothetical protein